MLLQGRVLGLGPIVQNVLKWKKNGTSHHVHYVNVMGTQLAQLRESVSSHVNIIRKENTVSVVLKAFLDILSMGENVASVSAMAKEHSVIIGVEIAFVRLKVGVSI